MKLKICVLGLLCLFFQAKAQPKTTIKNLQIGDQVPDVTIDNIINYKSAEGKPINTAKISDFKGKLIILDFWATWCSACMESFPKMEELQRTFEGKINIIASTTQEKGMVKKFLLSHKNPNGQALNLVTAVNDRTLTKLFPHHGIPHIVWIDQKGLVAAITGAEEVTENNIRAILNGTKFQFKEKVDFNTEQPLYLSASYPSYNQLLHYSVLSKSANPGLPSGSRLRIKGDTVYGRVITNSSLLQIYEAVARQLFKKAGGHYSSKQLILKVNDSTSVTARFKNGKYDLENEYNYDFIVPSTDADSLYSYMMQDLNKYTAYVGKIENRKVHCYSLIRTNNDDKIKTTGGPIINTLFYNKPAVLKNCPIQYLVNELNSLKDIPLPVVDNTNYKMNVDIQVSGNRNLAAINNDLSKYNLQLKEDYITIPMFILSDKPDNSLVASSSINPF